MARPLEAKWDEFSHEIKEALSERDVALLEMGFYGGAMACDNILSETVLLRDPVLFKRKIAEIHEEAQQYVALMGTEYIIRKVRKP